MKTYWVTRNHAYSVHCSTCRAPIGSFHNDGSAWIDDATGDSFRLKAEVVRAIRQRHQEAMHPEEIGGVSMHPPVATEIREAS